MPEFRILGPLEVVDEHGPISLGGQKQRALLGLLLVHAGAVVGTDRLVDQLWGEHPPKTATTSLQNLVSQLRKALGPDVLVTRPPGYVLDVDSEQLDLRRFERLVAEGRGLPPDERAAKLREALALWRGSPLADLSFETFAQAEIRRLEELRLEALEERIDADLEQGEGPSLVAELEALVAAYPLRERLRRELMVALYRAGRQADALEAYHEARRTLSEELGIDPGPALQQVYGSILRQETSLAAATSPRPEVDHYADVVKALLAGRLVPVLGEGVNRTGATGEPLPGLSDIAAFLAESFAAPEHRDLAQVSEYVALMKGVGPLYDELHDLLDRDFDPGPVHRSLAAILALVRDQASPLVLTTNFDLALEHACAEAGEKIDVVSYIASGRHRGRFLHIAADGDPAVVEVPNAYSGLPIGERTVVLRLLGQVDRRPEREWESFAVTEDDHIDYLAQADISSLVPVTLIAKLRRCHFLFLGYPLRDWGLRVFLHRVWGREKVAYRSWAVEPAPTDVERELWRQRGVDVLEVPLEEYMERLNARVAEAAR